jgi:hypothetical protein
MSAASAIALASRTLSMTCGTIFVQRIRNQGEARIIHTPRVRNGT